MDDCCCKYYDKTQLMTLLAAGGLTTYAESDTGQEKHFVSLKDLIVSILEYLYCDNYTLGLTYSDKWYPA